MHTSLNCLSKKCWIVTDFLQLGKTRMLIPVKAYDCTHLQCFDLSNFLKMNEKRPTWKCAVCNNGAPYKKLIIDGYVVFYQTNTLG